MRQIEACGNCSWYILAESLFIINTTLAVDGPEDCGCTKTLLEFSHNIGPFVDIVTAIGDGVFNKKGLSTVTHQ